MSIIKGSSYKIILLVKLRYIERMIHINQTDFSQPDNNKSCPVYEGLMNDLLIIDKAISYN